MAGSISQLDLKTANTSDNIPLDFSGATEGNLILACIAPRGNVTVTSVPSGWTLVDTAVSLFGNSSGEYCNVYRKIASASETEYFWGLSLNGKVSAVAIECIGTGNTVELTDTYVSGGTASISVDAGEVAVLFASEGLGSGTPADATPPSGFTEVSDGFGDRSAVSVAFQSYASAGSTGAVTYTNRNTGVLVSISAGTPSISPSTDKTGHFITVSSTNTTPANYAVKINGGSAVTPARAVRSTATATRLTLPNGTRILSGDTVTISSTADSVTDESVTNNSIQTATSIKMPTSGGGNVSLDFASAPTVGVTAAGIIQYTDAVAITGSTLTLGTNEEKYRCDVQLDPAWGDYSFGNSAVTFPYTPSADESLVARVWFPELSVHATSTEFEVGDVIQEGSEFYRVTTAGTTGGTKPTFDKSATISDGTVVWTFQSRDDGTDMRSVVQHVVYAVCAGATLQPETRLAPTYTDGSDKTWYDISDINTALLPGDTISGVNVGTATEMVEYPWYGIDENEFQYRVPGQNYPTYAQFIQGTWQTVVRAAFSDAEHTTILIERMVQRGIEQKGIREVGGFWKGNGGHSQARISMAIFAGGILEAGVAWFDALKQNSNASTDWAGTEFSAQITALTQTQIETVMTSEFQYSAAAAAGVGKTFLDPTSTPSTVGTGDSPSVAYFPASVRGSWLHVPEWGLRWDTAPELSSPLWSYHDATNFYRPLNGQEWAYLCYMIEAMGICETVDAPVFFDYTRRYQYIQGPENANASWDDQDLWALFEADEPAFAYTAQAVNVAGTWFIDLYFNRYATQTNANILSQFACSGSVTLSNADQTGPRTFRVQASADPRGQTITYTQSGTAANRVVDAGNNQLPTGSTASLNAVVSGTGQAEADGTIRMVFTRLSGLWGSTITPDNAKITAISQVTGGTRTYTVGSVSGAGTGTLQVIITPSPLIYSAASGGAVTLEIGEGWLTDENGNTTAAFSGIDDGDNSSTQEPDTGYALSAEINAAGQLELSSTRDDETEWSQDTTIALAVATGATLSLDGDPVSIVSVASSSIPGEPMGSLGATVTAAFNLSPRINAGEGPVVLSIDPGVFDDDANGASGGLTTETLDNGSVQPAVQPRGGSQANTKQESRSAPGQSSFSLGRGSNPTGSANG